MNPGVDIANPFDPNEMGSLGRAKHMLLRQYEFPSTYETRDRHMGCDHDRCEYDTVTWAFRKHTGTGEMGLAGWLRKADDTQVLLFLQDILKADPNVRWTGYRVTVTNNVSSGGAVWGLELFAKHPNSKTVVYTGPNFGEFANDDPCPPNVRASQWTPRDSRSYGYACGYNG